MEEDWERPPRVEVSLEELNQLIRPAFPSQEIRDHAVIATGLANTNVRFRVRGDETEYVLRLHTRDPLAAGRERAIMDYLAAHPRSFIPVAPLLYSNREPGPGNYPYSIWGFVEGTLLENLFRTLPAPELVNIASVCGRVLAALTAHPFPTCGEFDSKLEIVQEYGVPSHFIPELTYEALFKGRAGERLGVELRDELWRAVERWSPRLGAIDGRYTLVHADYKRSNILMRRSGATWSVSAVLDWEFACAGPPLIDVAIFLRAGERLPGGFREAFLSAYRDAGGELPSDWLPLSRLVDVVSQLTFLDDARNRPRVFAETIDVLKETLRVLT